MSSKDELIEFLSATYGVPTDELDPDIELNAAFGVDSLGLVTLGDKIQAHFGIELSTADLVECQTVGDFDALLSKLMNGETEVRDA